MRARRAHGFTLLELMIGLALLGLIMSVLFAGLQLAARNWDAADLAGERANRMRLVQNLLLRELSAVYPYRWKNTADLNLAFSGVEQRLRFVSGTPPRAGAGGLNLVELRVDKSEHGLQLQMRRQIPRREERDFGRVEDADSVLLLDGLEAATFDFFGSDTPGGKPSWRASWEDPQRLPRLIRVSLRSYGAPAWPDVIVAPRVSENAGCGGWDPINERCHGREGQ